MIIIVDYGCGNLQSVKNMISKAGGEAQISSNEDDILAAEKLVLPGVGHFDYGMRSLMASGLIDSLNEVVINFRRPILGICLGAQMLGSSSEEGTESGLGWLDMKCKRLPVSQGIRVPHMGWNQIRQKKPSPLLDSIEPDERFYFVHSFYMDCTQTSDILATTCYGIEFTCAVQLENIFGVQFHPEKSLRHGLSLMKSFVELGTND